MSINYFIEIYVATLQKKMPIKSRNQAMSCDLHESTAGSDAFEY